MPKKRREAAPRSLKRMVAIRRPRKTIVVFCEGEKTEPQYLQALKQQPSVRDVAAIDLRVEIGHGGDVPRTLVSLAVSARDRAAEEKDEVDEFWCVFDVEQPKNHPGLAEARRRAEANGIRLAISNPCFELWLILHFQSHGGWLDNDGARRLRRRLDGSADKSLDSAKYMPLIGDAARRAVELEKRHHGDGVSFPDDNPSSGMHLLISAAEPPSQ
jgi:RloB-like protein